MEVAREIVAVLACVLILAWVRHKCVTISRVAPGVSGFLSSGQAQILHAFR
jgi:hypothetical protein